MLVVLPYNIQSACSSNVSMDGYKLANVKTIYFSGDISPIQFTMVIDGIKYASIKVSDGLFDGLTKYHICSSSKGYNVYLSEQNAPKTSASRCPSGSTLWSSNIPTPYNVYAAIGTVKAWQNTCYDYDGFHIISSSGIRYYNFYGGNTIQTSASWSYNNDDISHSWGVTLCKLNYQ